MEGPLTIALWILSFAAGAITYTKTKQYKSALLRPLFAAMVTMTVWSILVTTFWSLGVELKVGTIRDGKMEDNTWLPLATSLFTALTYLTLRMHKRSPD